MGKDELLEKVVPEILVNEACNISTINLTSSDCVKDISLHVSDNVLYFAEKDPGFVAWTKNESNVEAWKKIKEGKLSNELQEVFTAPDTALTGFAAIEITFGTSWDSPEFKTWLTDQLD